MKKTAFILMSLLLMCSCEEWFTDDELSYVKTPNESSALRLDGYYFQNIKPNGVNIHLYYQNGVVYFTGQGQSLKYFENEFKTLKSVGFESVKAQWALFIIKNDSIYTNGLASPSYGAFHLVETFSKGVILNDTTIVYLESESSNGEFYNRNDTLHFKQFSPKPDSTNIFIK